MYSKLWKSLLRSSQRNDYERFHKSRHESLRSDVLHQAEIKHLKDYYEHWICLKENSRHNYSQTTHEENQKYLTR